MISALLILLAASQTPSDILDQAFHGRPGARWSGTAIVERPGDHASDTATICHEGTSERLDFGEFAVWMAGDSMVMLRPQEKSGFVHPQFPHPRGMEAKIIGADRYLGRNVLTMEVKGPFGHGRKLWVDTSLPAILKGEPLGKEGRRGPERQFLSIRPGVGCPPGSFQLAAGWTLRKGPPPPPPGGPVGPGGPGGEADGQRRHHPRHEVANLAELTAAVGFEPPPPPWLPAGFAPRSYGWIDSREGMAAQILYSNGKQNLSVFWRPAGGPPPFCPSGGCKDREGRPVVFGQSGKLGMAVTGDLSSEDLEKVAGTRK